MRVLLSEGSGLTSRQVATQLHAAGHTVGALTSDPLALTRFTRTVQHRHPVRPFGPRPFDWLEDALAVAVGHGYDVLLPTQEQVTVLSWAAGAGCLRGVATIVPDLAALRAVQDKVSARATLDRLGLPQPTSVVLEDVRDLRRHADLPVFAKRPIGTASDGVRLVAGPDDVADLVHRWAPTDGAGDEDRRVLLQSPVSGPLEMLQAVFDHGRLVAFHANLRVREGVRGGASHKRSVTDPAARTALEHLGRSLRWHGALSADAIVTTDGPVLIDLNPRLVEPGNAWRAGVDLVGPLVALAIGAPVAEQIDGRAGVLTHQTLLAVLGAAQHVGTRRAVMAELVSACTRSGSRGGHEELTPLRRDLRSAVPVAAAALATLVAPSTWTRFASASVANYAVTPHGWRAITARADEAAAQERWQVGHQ